MDLHVSRAHPERTINDLEDAWHQQPVAMVHGSTHEQSDFEDVDEIMGDVLHDELLIVNLDTICEALCKHHSENAREALDPLCNLYWGMYSQCLKWLAPITNTE